MKGLCPSVSNVWAVTESYIFALHDALPCCITTQFRVQGRSKRSLASSTGLLGSRKNSSFRAFLAVLWAITHRFWGPRTIFKAGQIRFTAICTSLELVVWDTSGPFSRAITHSFCVRGLFERPVTPGTRLLRGQQKSSFRALLAIFVGHNTLFWGPGMI